MIARNIAIKGYTFTAVIYTDDLHPDLRRGLVNYSYTIKGYFHFGLYGLYIDYIEICIPRGTPKLVSENYCNYPAIERQLSTRFRGVYAS